MTVSKSKPPKSTKSKPKPVVSLPIPAPAPPVLNYTGILEQIAQSMQDLVAESRTITEALGNIPDVVGELKSIATSMSMLSTSFEDYVNDLNEDDSETHTDSERLDWLFKMGDAAQHDRAAIDAAMDKDVGENDVVDEGKEGGQ